ncbi:CD109 antigen-like isoform X3 [Lineus longissimus]|uniref:CD109 antigen-like isoform X3 n=1 Tax=Lineus longissimus TaxID=88925 RepID=UPI00315CEE14
MSSAWMSILLVGILCVSASYAAGTWAVICPKFIRPGQNFICTVSMTGGTITTMDASLVNEKGQDFPNTKKTLTNIGNGVAKKLELTNVPTDLRVNDVKLKVDMMIDGTNVKNETALEIDRKSMSIFIQTDKAKYKPQDTLKFRIFATDENLMPVLKPLDIVLKDPKNDVFQWLNVTGKAEKNGVLSLEYIIPGLAELGGWSINIKSGDNSNSKKFTVEKYVLPRFEVNINTVSLTSGQTARSFLIEGSKDNPIEISAKYTFGENVNGVAHVTIKHVSTYNWGPNNKIKEDKFKETLSDGKVVLKVDVGTGIVHLSIFAEVVESDTDEKLNNSREIKVYRWPCKLMKMALTPTIYVQGLTYNGYLQVQSSDGTTYPDDVDITINYNSCSTTFYGYRNCQSSNNTKYQLPQPTMVKGGGDGIVPFSFDTKPGFDAYKVTATATCTKEEVSYELSKFETQNAKLGFSLKLVSDYDEIKVGVSASFKLCSKSNFDNFNLLVLSKGTIVYQKDYQIALSTCYLFDVLITRAMAPSAKFFVTYVGGSEMIGDYLELTIDGSMENSVSVKFNKPKAKLGEEVSVNVNAAPKSHVGLLCVDKSVLLLATGNDITQDDAIEEQRSYGKKIGNSVNDEIIPFFLWRCGPISSRSGNMHKMIKDLNLVVITAAHIEGFRHPFNGGGEVLFDGFREDAVMRKTLTSYVQNRPAPEVVKARAEFPETWIWSESVASSNGNAVFPAKVPDTITTWVCSAFALHKTKGLGIAPKPAELIAKKDFFVQLLMPYSIKNEESFILKVLVHRYTPDALDNVQVTLLASTKFETSNVFAANAVFKTNQPQTKYIEKMKDSTEMVAFHIRVPRVGTVKIQVEAKDKAVTVSDAIERDLRVEPTGVQRTVPITFLLSLNSSHSVLTKEVPIRLPSSGVVSGSEKIEVAAIGDIMGPSLKNMEGMIKMPYGCGEQNMINFAPAMFIYRYLNATDSLTPETNDKAMKVMERGYTRELTFFHTCCDIGSVSAFGDHCFGSFPSCSGQEGSTWLTAFVMKSFGQAAKYITISETGIYKGVDWLLSLQEPNGSFRLRGRVIHNDFQGGSAKGIALDAYVLISMMEYPEGFKDRQQIVKTKLATTATHLEKYARDLMNKLVNKKPTDKELYDLTIIAYAIALMDNPYADTLLTKLDALASVSDGEKYWKMSSPAKCDSPYRCYDVKPNPSEVEIASYALLAYLKRNKCSQNAGCSYISKWMAKKRGAKGGFCSTKDTVLGIQAISAFAQQQSLAPPNFSADFTYASQSAIFGVGKLNDKIFQEKEFNYQPKQSVNIRVNGSGSGLALVNYIYNEVTITKYTDKLDIDKDVSCSKLGTGEQVCTIKLCISQQSDVIKGMSLVESSCLSGFEPYGEVKCDGCSSMKLNKYEVDEAKFVAYLNFVSSNKQCLIMTCIQKQVVTYFQPAVITFADYYSTDVRTEVMYSAPQSLMDQNACKECGVACGCVKGPLEGNSAAWTTPMIFLTTCMLVLARMMI